MSDNSPFEQEEHKELAPPKDELTEFLQELDGKISKERINRSTRIQNEEEWYNWRRGRKGRTYKPLGTASSDIPFRLSDPEINERNARFVLSVHGSPRVVRFVHKSPSADVMENYFDYLFRCKMDNYLGECMAEADLFHEYGYVFTKQTWDYETELYTDTATRDEILALLTPMAANKAKAAVNALGQTAMAKMMAESPTGAVMPEQMVGMQSPRDAINKLTPEEKDATLKLAGIEMPMPLEQVDKINDPAQLHTILTNKEKSAILAGWLKLDLEDDDNKDAYQARIDSIIEQLGGSERIIEFIRERVLRNQPRIQVIRDRSAITYPAGTVSIQDAEWIEHRFKVPKRRLQALKKEDGGIYSNVDELLEDVHAANEDALEQPTKSDQADEKGLTHEATDKDSITLAERHCFVKRKWLRGASKQMLKDGDSMVRAVITVCPDKPDLVLRKIEYPYKFRLSHARWCFAACVRKKGWGDLDSGEGIPKEINSFEEAYNVDMNSARDRNTVSLSPPVIYRRDSGIKPSQFRAWPQALGVDGPVDINGAVQVMQYPNLANGFKSDALDMKIAAKEAIGTPDLSPLSSYQDSPSATEIQQRAAPGAVVTQSALVAYHQFKAEQYRQIYDLVWEYQFEDEKQGYAESFPDSQSRGLTHNIRKEDFYDDYVITSGADTSEGNPVLQAQKRFAFGGFLLSNPMLAPFYKMGELVTVLSNDALGYTMANRIMTPMDEAQKRQADMQSMMQQAQQAVMAQMKAAKTGKPGSGSKGKALANASPVNTGIFTG